MWVHFGLIATNTSWERLVNWLTTPSLQLFLLLGCIVLAVCLLLLTTTRLGHAKPITKCIVLSVIAHILLIGYAYGTKLIFQFPLAQSMAPIRIQWIDDDQANDFLWQNESIDLPRESIQNLEQPNLMDVVRPDLDALFEPDKLVDIVNPAAPHHPNLIDQSIEIPLSNSEKLFARIESPPLPFDFSSAESATILEPQMIEIRRRGEGEQDVHDLQPPLESNSLTDAPPQMMEFVELQPEILSKDAFPSDIQRAEQFESELILPDAEIAITEELMSRSTIGSSIQPTLGNDLADQRFSAETDPTPISARRLGDGQLLPQPMILRAAVNRNRAALTRGGSEQTEIAVEAGLQWLASTQSADGGWDPKLTEAGREDRVFGHDRGACGADADMGITALATLAFLGAGNSHLEGTHKKSVQKALEFLIKNQKRNGDLSGNAKLFARTYCHSMALLAISEALALSGDRRLEEAVRRGVDFSVQAQDKAGGGWRYQPGDAGDMSQFGWQVMALHSSALGGIQVEPATTARMRRFLNSCRTGTKGGLASYRPGEGPSSSMTAEALVCDFFLDGPVLPSRLIEAQQRILGELPQNARPNYYYWYYATLAMYQSGGPSWQLWNQELQRVLLSQQESAGQHTGSWPPNGLWCGYGGRVYSTALATMCLEVYYRYLSSESTDPDRAVQLPQSRY